MEVKGEITDVSFDARGRQRITFTLEHRADVSELMGKILRLTAKVWRRRRSLNANAYFHTLVGKIAEKTSQSVTEVHNQLIADYGRPEIIHEALVPIILRDTIDWRRLEGMHLRPTGKRKVLDDGKLYQVYMLMRGSHTYDTKEMSRLIEGTIWEAEGIGIETITPLEKERMLQLWQRKAS